MCQVASPSNTHGRLLAVLFIWMPMTSTALPTIDLGVCALAALGDPPPANWAYFTHVMPFAALVFFKEGLFDDQLKYKNFQIRATGVNDRCAPYSALENGIPLLFGKGLVSGRLHSEVENIPPVAAISGCSCSTATMALTRVAATHRILMVGGGPTDPGLSNKDVYPWFVRAGVPGAAVAKTHAMLTARFGWHRLVTVSCDAVFCANFAQALLEAMSETNPKAEVVREIFADIEISPVPEDFGWADKLDLANRVRSLIPEPRIIWMSQNSMANALSVLRAFDEFGFVGPPITWLYQTDCGLGNWKSYVGSSGTCSFPHLKPFSDPDDIWEGFFRRMQGLFCAAAESSNSHLYRSVTWHNFWTNLTHERLLEVGFPATADFMYNPQWFKSPDIAQYGSYYPLQFDEMLTLIFAIDGLLASGTAEQDIREEKLKDAVLNVKFDGLGGTVAFDENGDRLGQTHYINWQNDVETGETVGVKIGWFDLLTGKLDISGFIFADGTATVPSAVPEPCPSGSQYGGLSSGCVQCPSGRYSPLGAVLCFSCPPGSAAPNVSSSSCEPCNSGFYAPAASPSCLPCPVGTADGKAGQMECPCALGWFSRNSSSCVRCPDLHQTTPYQAATSEEECQCQAGFHFRPGHGCTQCGEGLKCNWQAGSNDPPTQLAGYNVEVLSQEDRKYSVYACPREEACPSGALGGCSGGASGRMCLQCPIQPERMYWSKSKGRCVQCSESGGGQWALPVAVIVLLLIMTIVYKSSLPKDDREQLSSAVEVAVSLGLFMVMAQTAAVFSRLDIAWGSPVDEILVFCRIFALDLGILQLDCAVGLDYVDRFFLGSALPLIGAGLYALAAGMLQHLKMPDAELRCVNSVGLIMQSIFIGILLHGVEPFIVFIHPNGKKSMVAGPEVLEGSDLHNQLSTLGIIHLLFYGVGFFSVCAFGCRRIWLRALSGESRGIRAILWFRFLYFKFRPNRYYWGLAHIVRAGLISLTPVIFDSAYRQIVMLNFLLTSFAVLQAYFWPYKANMHNVADIAVSGAMISLCTAGAFFLPPGEAGLHKSIVEMVLVMLVLSFTLLCSVFAIPVGKIMYARLQSQEWRERQKISRINEERTFLAKLSKTNEDDLFGAEELHVDVEKIISVKPELDVASLVSYSSQELSDECAVQNISIIAPSAHPDARATFQGLAVYEKKIRWRAQEFFSTSGDDLKKRKELQKRHYSDPTNSPVVFSSQEKKCIQQLVTHTQTFMKAYITALLTDSHIQRGLQEYVKAKEAEFHGLYQVCVRDMLQMESGFYAVIGLTNSMQKYHTGHGQSLSTCSESTPKDFVQMYTSAVVTQELLAVYGAELAGATKGIFSMGGTKHIWRMLEKECLDPLQTRGGQRHVHLDVARCMVAYNNMSELLCGLERLQQDHKKGQLQLLRLKDRFSNPTSGGWSDILVNICFVSNDPHVLMMPCEIQFVHTRMMLIRQDMGAHEVYAKYRTAFEVQEFQANAQQQPTYLMVDTWEVPDMPQTTTIRVGCKS